MIQLLQKHGFIYDQLPAILWALLIFVASSFPSVTLPEIEFISSDKAIHVVVYFVLCVFLYRALSNQRRLPQIAKWSLACAVLLSIIYGASDEFHQSFVPNRDASIYDLAADSIGALLFLSYSILRRPGKINASRTV